MTLCQRKRLLWVGIATLFLSSYVSSLIAQQIEPPSIHKGLAELETSSDGRLGVFAINTANNEVIQYRATERFPMCSTGKVLCVSAILKQSMKAPDLLQQRVMYTKKDVDSSGYAPVTKNFIVDGMTISELCKAAITQSDNTAMNLLMKKLGGPAVVTGFVRSIGDEAFKLNRFEPDLNSAIPNDSRDTATPVGMAKSLQRLAFSHVLAKSQREQLLVWLKNNTTGDARIRAGVPKTWVVGDKTGTGRYGTTNDIAIIWPPKCPPIIAAIYFTQNEQDAAPREDVIASVTRILLHKFSENDNCINKAHL